MTKEEYLAKVEKIEKQIDELKREKSELYQQYLDEHRNQWPIGAKVKVYSKYRPNWCDYGIVVDVKVAGGDVWPILAKIKKDGTAHATARLFLWDNELEIVEDSLSD